MRSLVIAIAFVMFAAPASFAQIVDGAGGSGGGGAVTNAGTFAVQEDGAALTALQLIDDTIYADDGEFTTGTSPIQIIGGLYESAPTSCTDGDVCSVELSSDRRLLVDADIGTMPTVTLAGTESEDNSIAYAGTHLVVENLNYCDNGANWERCSTAAAGSGTVSSATTRVAIATEDKLFTDPCLGGTKVYAPIDIVTITTTNVTPTAAGASNHVYICAVNLVTAGANNVALVSDTTTACATPVAGLAGGTTAAEGWNFAANGGIAWGSGSGTIAR